MKQVLILGGTSDAAELATRAAQLPGIQVITSLAGRTQNPTTLLGSVRVGSFGGASGLADYLRDRPIHLLIDATHPFAAQISWNAATAAATVGIPHLMLIRPAWQKTSGDRWIEVENNAAAATTLPGLAQRVFLTIGRQELSVFAHLKDIWFLMRMIDPPSPNAAAPKGEVLLERGPFELERERELMIKHGIEAIVSKNSGGMATYAKIIAAQELRIPVVMVQRPSVPPIHQVATVEQALIWVMNYEKT
jgi:precorrin-6A/cobalt-precorrin-6A reductase